MKIRLLNTTLANRKSGFFYCYSNIKMPFNPLKGICEMVLY